MYFFFVIKKHLFAFSFIIAYPMSEINTTFDIFYFGFIKPFIAFFPFVSNGDSLDWRGLNCEQMLERIIPKTKSGDILLFHNDTAHTAESLDKILTELEKKRLFIFKGQ